MPPSLGSGPAFLTDIFAGTRSAIGLTGADSMKARIRIHPEKLRGIRAEAVGTTRLPGEPQRPAKPAGGELATPCIPPTDAKDVPRGTEFPRFELNFGRRPRLRQRGPVRAFSPANPARGISPARPPEPMLLTRVATASRSSTRTSFTGAASFELAAPCRDSQVISDIFEPQLASAEETQAEPRTLTLQAKNGPQINL